ncbi:hypothetical protein [Oscillatoria sp. FACHB-1407]|uniref:hypothetical protein n=1 Tax=Oscillatoria sp. FACHB-1407 TaxID=2692847 RepID=UPI0030D831D3
MSIQSQRTSRFIDWWYYMAGAIAVVMFIALIISPFMGQMLISTQIQVDEGEPEELQAVQMQPQSIGALRVDVKAIIPTNRWVTYEIQLRDQQDQVIASALKDAWAESGTWYEEGESGTWQEEDLLSGLDVRALQPEALTITLDVLSYTTSAGVDVDESVTFNVQVRNGVVDTRYLWAGLVGAIAMVVLAAISVPLTGDRVISKWIGDSDVGDRALMGGANRLVRVTVKVKSDETSPRHLTIKLFVKDGNGEQIYARDFPVTLRFIRNKERELIGASASLCKFFILEPRSSYGFYVEVVPDNPVDSTHLIVRDRAKTQGSVDVIHLRANEW